MESEAVSIPISQRRERPMPLRIAKYSIGVGDRFAHQAPAQLRACMLAADQGIEIIPVWNKSNREHGIVGSSPISVRAAAQEAVDSVGWTRGFHVDADHINYDSVDAFLDSSDFFTIDVAAAINRRSPATRLERFLSNHSELFHPIHLPTGEVFRLSKAEVGSAAQRYLAAADEAGRIYRKICAAKESGTFITEVSMDETDSPQQPGELAVILAALADAGVPVQTIAPKFTGRFNKGVDYVGNVAQFEREFRSDVAVIAWAVKTYNLPECLKLSIHSGSDKFSLYPAIHAELLGSGAGVHLKTAGTTWLEELIGLAEAGGKGLALAKEIYRQAREHREELCAPYASVIDIDASKLPIAKSVNKWTSEQFVGALRHDPQCPAYNPSFRQLLHVGYKIAAKMGPRYLQMLGECAATVSRNVTQNLYARHILPVFRGLR